jgi:hypothetical protein
MIGFDLMVFRERVWVLAEGWRGVGSGDISGCFNAE